MQRPLAARLPLLVALLTASFHAALVLTTFPADLQFSKYPRAAAQYLSGALPAQRILDFSPFYLYLHAALQPLAAGWSIIGLHILATSAAATLLFLLLRRFFPTWIAAAGTTAFALNPGIAIYTPVFEPEPFLVLALVGFLYFSLRPERRSTIAAAFFLALAVSIRPSVLPLLFVVPLFWLVNDGRSRWLRRTSIMLAPAFAVLLGLVIRNGAATGSYSPLVMNPGFVFFEGNNPLSSGRSSVYPPVVGELKQEVPDHPDNPHLTYRLVAERAHGAPLSTGEANRYWRGRATAFIADHPGRFLSLLASKAYFALHGHARHDVVIAQRYGERLRERWIPLIPFALVSALALGGLVVSARDWRPRLLIYALFAGQLATMLAFYVSERQRLAVVPGFVFFACAALARLAAQTGRRRAALVAFGVLGAALMLPNDAIRDERHLWRAYAAADRARVQAFQAQRDGRLGDAGALAAASFAAAPWLRDYARPAGVAFDPGGFAERALAAGNADGDASQRFDRAQLYIEAGRLDEAERLLERLRVEGGFDRGYVQSSEVLYHLARIAAKRGRTVQAVEQLNEALARTPGDPFVLARLAALTGDDVYRQRIVRYFGEIDAAFLIGIARFEERTEDRGLSDLTATVRLLPEFWRARIYLAAALGETGDVATGTEFFRHAMADRQDQMMLEDRILPIFARAAAIAEDEGLTQYHYGMVLAQYGRWLDALEVLRETQAAHPRPQVARTIDQIESMIGR